MDALARLPEMDSEVYLIDPQEWIETVAEAFARQELGLIRAHWQWHGSCLA